jgi:hypothetical protein
MLTSLDLIQSTIFGGAILLLVLQLNGSLTDSYTEQSSSVITQQNAIDVGTIMANDLSKMGYQVPAGTPVITSADTLGNITFKADINGTTTWVDSIKYQFIRPTGQKYYMIQRNVNTAAPTSMYVNIDSILVTYYKAGGTLIPASMLATQAGRDSVRSLKVRMHFDDALRSSSTAASDTSRALYTPSAVSWETTIAPHNIQSSK